MITIQDNDFTATTLMVAINFEEKINCAASPHERLNFAVVLSIQINCASVCFFSYNQTRTRHLIELYFPTHTSLHSQKPVLIPSCIHHPASRQSLSIYISPTDDKFLALLHFFPISPSIKAPRDNYTL